MAETRDLDGNPAKKRDGYRPTQNLSGGSPLFRPVDPSQPDRSEPHVFNPYQRQLSEPPIERHFVSDRPATFIKALWTTPKGRSYAIENVTDLKLLDIAILGLGCRPEPWTPATFVIAVRNERHEPSLDAKIILTRVTEMVVKGYMGVERASD